MQGTRDKVAEDSYLEYKISTLTAEDKLKLIEKIFRGKTPICSQEEIAQFMQLSMKGKIEEKEGKQSLAMKEEDRIAFNAYRNVLLKKYCWKELI